MSLIIKGQYVGGDIGPKNVDSLFNNVPNTSIQTPCTTVSIISYQNNKHILLKLHILYLEINGNC